MHYFSLSAPEKSIKHKCKDLLYLGNEISTEKTDRGTALRVKSARLFGDCCAGSNLVFGIPLFSQPNVVRMELYFRTPNRLFTEFILNVADVAVFVGDFWQTEYFGMRYVVINRGINLYTYQQIQFAPDSIIARRFSVGERGFFANKVRRLRINYSHGRGGIADCGVNDFI